MGKVEIKEASQQDFECGNMQDDSTCDSLPQEPPTSDIGKEKDPCGFKVV